MTETKITAPGVERTEDGQNDLNLQGQSITAALDCQAVFRVFPLLPKGEDNAISTRELMALTGYSTARALQSRIEFERLHGALICSRSGNGGGYFRPSDGEAGREELLRYCSTLRARAINTLRTLRTARRALGYVVGQLELEEVEDGAEKGGAEL